MCVKNSMELEGLTEWIEKTVVDVWKVYTVFTDKHFSFNQDG